jgi:hypothetical protein
MLNNITNFFNLIKTGKVKTQLDATDLLPIGTKDLRFSGQYQPTMIKYGDFISGLVGGSNGQVLFNDNDTIAGASTFYWDKVNNRVGIGTSTPTNTLDINGTARVQGNLTTSAGIQNFSNYQGYGQMQLFSASGFQMFNQTNNSRADFQYVTGSGLLLNINAQSLSGTLKALTLGANLIASANNDSLVGLDINPTFTNGAFTGVKNLGLRVGASYSQYNSTFGHGAELNTNVGISGSLDLGGDSSVLYLWRSGSRQNGASIGSTYVTPNFGHIYFGTWNTKQMILSNATGNLLIGTTTDAGFRLDVNGTARVSATDGVSAFQITAPNRAWYFTTSAQGGTFNAISGAANGVNGNGNYGYVLGNGWAFNIGLTTSQPNSFFSVYPSGTNQGEVRIGGQTGNGSSLLTIESTTKGFLPPRMDSTQKNAISGPAAGLMIYDTTLNRPCFYNGTTWITL